MATQIVISISGGLVREVYCSDPQAEVRIVDWDAEGTEDWIESKSGPVSVSYCLVEPLFALASSECGDALAAAGVELVVPEPVSPKALLGTVYSRAVFKNKLQERIGAALGEFFKAECAMANGLTKWVDDWMREVNQLLSYMATQVYLHPINGFEDRHKALTEALAELQEMDAGYRNYAMNSVVKDCEIKKLKCPVPADATQRFYALVEDYIRRVEQAPPLES